MFQLKLASRTAENTESFCQAVAGSLKIESVFPRNMSLAFHGRSVNSCLILARSIFCGSAGFLTFIRRTWTIAVLSCSRCPFRAGSDI